ncbi:MAG: alanine racemase [Bacteroidota bacterium]
MAEIDLSAVAFNLRGVRKKVGSGTKVMAVVKANAYGHGIGLVAPFVESAGLADYFGVAFAEEGIALREAGLRKPIHVFTIPFERQASLFTDFNLEPTVSSIQEIAFLERSAVKAKRTLPIHLKIDTGMNRIGVKSAELEAVVSALRKARRLAVQGVFTHFATADEVNKQFLMHQLDEFHRQLERLRHLGLEAGLVHCANSASILDLPESAFSMVRPGVMMYGYYPSRTTSESIPLKVAMTLKSCVSLVKWIGPGESVSYGRRFVATKRTQIATIPIGYADGYTRLLSGKAGVLIRGKKYPIAGSICMDQLMVDVGADEVLAGDEVVLIGSQGSGQISAWDLASSLGTIPYEICCAISSRVPRVALS